MPATKSKRILQIIPADGWLVAYEVDGKPEAWPLACWALVEEVGKGGVLHTSVSGVDMTGGGDAGIDVCDETGNFLGYLAPGQSPDYYAEDALARRRGREERKRKDDQGDKRTIAA
jgi:hypothetical protein